MEVESGTGDVGSAAGVNDMAISVSDGLIVMVVAVEEVVAKVVVEELLSDGRRGREGNGSGKGDAFIQLLLLSED